MSSNVPGNDYVRLVLSVCSRECSSKAFKSQRRMVKLSLVLVKFMSCLRVAWDHGRPSRRVKLVKSRLDDINDHQHLLKLSFTHPFNCISDLFQSLSNPNTMLVALFLCVTDILSLEYGIRHPGAVQGPLSSLHLVVVSPPSSMPPIRTQPLIHGSNPSPLSRSTTFNGPYLRSPSGHPDIQSPSGGVPEARFHPDGLAGHSGIPSGSNLLLNDGDFYQSTHVQGAYPPSTSQDSHPAMFGSNSRFLVNGGNPAFHQHSHVHQAHQTGGKGADN
ncbi:hypothetical protein BJ165DRAFT_226660 [Panaeolus papilionaceus]|nr:hypothetical protein BJ165DRAFT_226660 [Panaeolus papilionaceus]